MNLKQIDGQIAKATVLTVIDSRKMDIKESSKIGVGSRDQCSKHVKFYQHIHEIHHIIPSCCQRESNMDQYFQKE